jgi:D-arginine dehydrogenase
MDRKRCDILIIGGGIAGVSAAYELAIHGSVILLEAEQHPGFHATGRSAAFFTGLYGNAVMRGLTSASRSFYDFPPGDLFEEPLLASRGVLYIARSDQRATLDGFLAEVGNSGLVEWRNRAFGLEVSPLLSPNYLSECAWEADASEIDVHTLLTGYLGGARRRGAQLITGHRVVSLARKNNRWRARAGDMEFEADVVVNAAGAWVDRIATMADCAPLHFAPLRRSACMLPVPTGAGDIGRAVVIDVDEQFYFKPDAGQILLSPADETLIEPCDVYPDDMDIAIAVDRFERATNRRVRRVTRSWAGLRTFAADRTIVIGFDPGVKGFFWLAGQGGYGIQTAPAAARCAAALVLCRNLPADVMAQGISTADISPARFGRP